MFEVIVRFTVGGPAVTGQWSDSKTAAGKFRAYVNAYGSHATVTIALTETGPGHPTLLRTWDREHGETVFTA